MVASQGEKSKFIDVLSDSTGETAEKVVRAALLQFPQSGVQIRLHTRVRTQEVARPILERAAQEGALVVFTIINTIIPGFMLHAPPPAFESPTIPTAPAHPAFGNGAGDGGEA